MPTRTYKQYIPRRTPIVLGASSSAPSNSANIITTNKRKGVKKNKGYEVSKSFAKAYWKMQPTKFYRDNITDITMDTFTSMATRMQSSQLNDISKGQDVGDRIGSSIYITGVKIKGTIQSNSANKTKFIRIMIVRNNNCNADTLDTTAYHNLYQNESFAEVAPSGVQTDGRLNVNRDVVHCYSSKIFKIKSEAQDAVQFNYWVPIKWTTNYAYDSTVGSNPLNGRIYLVVNLFDGDNNSTSTTVIFSCQATLYFKDGQRTNHS